MKCVILVGHGAVPSDCPPELAGEYKRLEGRASGRISARFAELDSRIRRWPRTPETDPYQAGLEEIARALADRMSERRVIAAYNEFCAPTLEEAFARAVAEGAGEITVISTMYTRGGVHSEKEIPAALERLRRAHPQVTVRYAWPINLEAVGRFLADEIARAEAAPLRA